MAFKNSEALKQMMKKKPVPQQELPPTEIKTTAEKAKKKAEPKDKAEKSAIKEVEDKRILKDKNGVAFLQKSAFKRTVQLNIRITEETKANIDILTEKYDMSQADLIIALVREAMEREAGQ